MNYQVRENKKLANDIKYLLWDERQINDKT